MEKIQVDEGKSFDFGKTSADYAKFRDIYPKELYDKLYSLGIGKSGTTWLDLGTGTGVIPRGLASHGAKITGVDISPEQIAQAELLSKDFKNINYKVSKAEDLDFPENYFDAITAVQCFWYFDPNVIVPKIKSIIKNGGIFLKVYMGWVKDDPIAAASQALVKELNPTWTSGSPAVQDLKMHYFENPQNDIFEIDLPFSRECWHGRMKACRGTLASMPPEVFREFEKRHLEMMSDLPETFTVRHKVFVTWYEIEK